MKILHLAAAVGAAALSVGLAATAATAAGEGPTRVERVFVITDKDGHEVRQEVPGDTAVRVFNVGPNGAGCPGRQEVNAESAEGREKTHIILCAAGEGNDADRAEHLEQAISRIEQNQDLSAEHKEKVIAALREAIDRLNAAH
jgi:hypothetical protein